MSHSSPSSTFQVLFDTALQDYENQTGTKLLGHPLAKQLEVCDTVGSITDFLQERSRAFREFRGEDGKVMRSLKRIVHVLYSLSASTVLGESIGMPFPPAKAIFAGFAILLTTTKDISASYDAVVDLLESTGSFLNRLDIYTKLPPMIIMSEIIIKIMVELLSTLAVATKQINQGRPKKFIKKLLGENDVEAILQRLDRLTLEEARTTAAQNLQAVYGLVQNMRVVMDDGRAMADDVREALDIIGQLRCDKLQKDIRSWLSPPDSLKNHKIARESQHAGTETWWIHGAAYAEWKSSGGPSSLLWIHGKPGAGKSVLCSVIIDDIQGMRTSESTMRTSLAFFYCDFRDDKKQERRGLLSSLLVQLCDQSDSYCAVLSDFYLTHDNGFKYASDTELVHCLKSMLSLPKQSTAYIVIDALDECSTSTGLPSSRDNVLELVDELVQLRAPNLRICVTSRPEADIKPVVGPLAFRSVSLHSESGQLQAIAEYVKFVVNNDAKMRTWSKADKERVIDVLVKKADGMFRWVYCQLAYLRHCLPGRIRRALEELPKSLDGTYERTLEDIGDQNWEYAHRLFQCVAAAARPLRVEELAEFLAFDFEGVSTPEYLNDWRPEDPGHTVLLTCSSLLAVVNVDDTPVVQFTHFSVKEYLTSTRISKAKDTISRFHVSMRSAHTIVAQASLAVLLHFDENVTKSTLDEFPLAEYAAEHWSRHARFEDVSQNIEDGMKRLFDPRNHHLAIWVWIYDPEWPKDRDKRPERPSQARATPLHYAAFCGIHDMIKFLIVERSQDVNSRGFGGGETPLKVACRRGHLDVTRVLLEHDADKEARDTGPADWSPLESASSAGHVDVVRLLLDHGADVKTRDRSGVMPLHLASGQVAVARMLLEKGADVNAQEHDKDTPLHRASRNGRVEAIRVLLEHGADVDARNDQDETPLLGASREGHLGAARLLLQYNADVHAQDSQGLTPFQNASASGHHEVMQLLLEHGGGIKEMH